MPPPPHAAASFATHPPPRLSSLASLSVAERRHQVGEVDVKDWQRAVSIRDPVSRLKRTHAHVNRATFKLHEIVARLFVTPTPHPSPHPSPQPPPPRRCASSPRNAAFLAEAPGGFLYCARRVWPECECFAMSSTAPGAIEFSARDDPAILADLPHHADLRHADVEEAIVERCGAASVEFVSADGGANVEDLNAAEQHSTPLVLAQTSVALRLQAQGGHFVLKVFEGCTLVTRQLFEILRDLYTHIMLFKPLSSKVCNSERYVVAMGLRSPVVARAVAQRLRAVVDRCGGGGHTDADSDRPVLFVESLGVEVGEMAHQAFDRMAQEQADAIKTLVDAIRGGRVSDLRAVAGGEAKELERMFDAAAVVAAPVPAT